MTNQVKLYIDSQDYEALLRRWRFAPAGDEMFQGEAGHYWAKRMAELRDKDPGGAVAASKRVGWERK